EIEGVADRLDLTERVETISLGNLVGDGRPRLRRGGCWETEHCDQPNAEHGNATPPGHQWPPLAARRDSSRCAGRGPIALGGAAQPVRSSARNGALHRASFAAPRWAHRAFAFADAEQRFDGCTHIASIQELDPTCLTATSVKKMCIFWPSAVPRFSS